MRLSEAIRLGATLRPQGRGKMLDEKGRSCAGGAALDAIGKLTDFSFASAVEMYFPIWALETGPRPAVLEGVPRSCMSVGQIVVWLNDSCRWTREAIANWVEDVEERQAVLEGRQDKEEEHEAALA